MLTVDWERGQGRGDVLVVSEGFPKVSASLSLRASALGLGGVGGWLELTLSQVTRNPAAARLGRTVLRMGMLAGSPCTMMGARTDPIMPPKAAAPAMAAVERILSFSENQPWLILMRRYFSSLARQDH